MAQVLGSLIEQHSSATIPIPSPALVYQKGSPRPSHGPTEYELDQLQWGKPVTGPSQVPVGYQTPKDLETSVPSTPLHNEIVGVIQSWNNPPVNKWRMLAACLMQICNGLNDSAPGAIIPYMEKHYNIGYAMVSLIFVTNAAGFISAAPLTHIIETRFGRARSYMFAEMLMVAAYVAIVCAPPFGVVVASFFFIGFGIALNLAMNQVFCANLSNNTAVLGVLHGSYGMGGTIGPLMATAIVSRGIEWPFFYFIPLAVASINVAMGGWSFRNYEQESPVQLLSALERTASRRALDDQPTKGQLLKQALENKTTLLSSLFIFAYQGAEVSISGWVISFLIHYRHGDPSRVGYVTAGFWAGITIGRFALSHPAHKIGEKISVVVLVVGAAAFQLLVWLVPNVIGDAVAVSIVGLLLGPVYPCATAVSSRLLPRRMQMSSLSIISAMGSSGGAVAPFVTGILSEKLGTIVLHPICIGLFVVMELSWLALPRSHKRRE